jgi:prephenate dehydrogenase
VGVLGCGLVGASLAAALTAAGETVWGCDRRDLGPLAERGWIARQVAAEELAEVSLAVLALPPAGILGALARLPFRPGQTVTDTGSVKVPVEAAAARLPRGVRFVGGHPLAGGTGQGFEAARPDLFEGAVWVLSETGDPEARELVAAVVRAVGAEPVVCGAERHDRLVAWTSHLPQLLATSLAAELEALDDPLVPKLLGPGGRNLLRLAESPWALWRQILAANRDAVAGALAAVTSRASQPPEAMEEDFAAARRLMEDLGRR